MKLYIASTQLTGRIILNIKRNTPSYLYIANEIQQYVHTHASKKLQEKS